MKKIRLMVFVICCISCNKIINIDKQVYSKTSEIGTIYLFYKDSSSYIQILYLDSDLKAAEGTYLKEGNSLTLYDYKFYDKELLSVFHSDKIFNIKGYLKDELIYFDDDYPEINFHKIGKNSLPLIVQNYIDGIISK